MPRHASALLDRLLGVGPAYETVAQLQADLAATHNRPTHVTRPLRAGHLAVLTACLAPGLATMLLIGTVPIALTQVRQSTQRIEKQNKEQEAKLRREQSLPTAEPIAETKTEEKLSVQEQNVLMLLSCSVWPILWIIWAFASDMRDDDGNFPRPGKHGYPRDVDEAP